VRDADWLDQAVGVELHPVDADDAGIAVSLAEWAAVGGKTPGGVGILLRRREPTQCDGRLTAVNKTGQAPRIELQISSQGPLGLGASPVLLESLRLESARLIGAWR
jgi:hypothetical protein